MNTSDYWTKYHCGPIYYIADSIRCRQIYTYQSRWHKRFHMRCQFIQKLNANQVTRNKRFCTPITWSHYAYIVLNAHFSHRQKLLSRWFHLRNGSTQTCNQDRLIISQIKSWIKHSQNCYSVKVKSRITWCSILKFLIDWLMIRSNFFLSLPRNNRTKW